MDAWSLASELETFARDKVTASSSIRKIVTEHRFVANLVASRAHDILPSFLFATERVSQSQPRTAAAKLPHVLTN